MATADLTYPQVTSPPASGLLAVLEKDGLFIIACLLHLGLGVLMEQFRIAATVDGLLTYAIGFYIVFYRRTWKNLLLFCGYVAGMEVVWRMTDAQILWESGKYLMIFILGLGLLRDKNAKLGLGPLIFFVLFLPSVPSIVLTKSFNDWRQLLSFNLSGPLALAVALLAFSNLSIQDDDLLKTYQLTVIPVFAAAGAILIYLATHQSQIGYINDSNATFSAGFGANQVSAILGLGSALAFIVAASNRTSRFRQIILFAASGGFLVQAIFTFSRGGVYMAAIVIAIVSMLLLLEKRAQPVILILAFVTPLLFAQVILPRIENTTGGALSTRFEDTNTSGRLQIAEGDILAWRASPFLGVGPGGSLPYHAIAFAGAQNRPHNEYTRALGEHGIFGVLAYLLLFIMIGNNLLKSSRSIFQFALLSSLALWGLIFLAYTGFRLAAPALLMGMTALTVQPFAALPETANNRGNRFDR